MQTQQQTVPPITAEVRQRLESLATKIKTHRAALVECDGQLPQMAARLERLETELQTALVSCNPDDENAVDMIVRGTARKLLLQNAARSIPGRRQQIMAELVMDMRTLDRTLALIAARGEHSTSFFDLKNSEFSRCDEALAHIASKLN